LVQSFYKGSLTDTASMIASSLSREAIPDISISIPFSIFFK